MAWLDLSPIMVLFGNIVSKLAKGTSEASPASRNCLLSELYGLAQARRILVKMHRQFGRPLAAVGLSK